jgi:hypothetical protein
LGFRLYVKKPEPQEEEYEIPVVHRIEMADVNPEPELGEGAYAEAKQELMVADDVRGCLSFASFDPPPYLSHVYRHVRFNTKLPLTVVVGAMSRWSRRT